MAQLYYCKETHDLVCTEVEHVLCLYFELYSCVVKLKAMSELRAVSL